MGRTCALTMWRRFAPRTATCRELRRSLPGCTTTSWPAALSQPADVRSQWPRSAGVGPAAARTGLCGAARAAPSRPAEASQRRLSRSPICGQVSKRQLVLFGWPGHRIYERKSSVHMPFSGPWGVVRPCIEFPVARRDEQSPSRLRSQPPQLPSLASGAVEKRAPSHPHGFSRGSLASAGARTVD